VTSFSSHPPDLVIVIGGGLILLLILLRLPYIGAALRILFSIGLVAVAAVLLAERAPYDPLLSGVVNRFHLDGQEVVGNEVRLRMGPSGHFFATATIDGVKRRMMVDSGATVTALSERTAAEAGLTTETGLLPVMLTTANGTVSAQTATVKELRLGDIVARDLKVVVSPAFGDLDLLGMNFLSKLKSWRVEDGTLILVPHHPQKTQESAGGRSS